MPNVVTVGEILVEIMRKERDVPHSVPGVYLGPYPSGAPAIFIDAVARLGESAGIVGAVGADEFGEMLINRLRRDGVDVSRIKVLQGYTTGTAFVMYYSSGERRFIFHLRHAAAGALKPDDVDPEYIVGAKVLHIVGSSLSISDTCREACYKAINLASKAGVTISFDPNLRPELLDVATIRRICEPALRRCHIVLPSAKEAEVLTGEADPIRAAEKLLSKGPELVVVKMGCEGAILMSSTGKIVKQPAFKVKEVDPTGAGDVFDGAFIVAQLRGWGLERALKFACAAGAIKVTRFGPMEGPISLEEVLKFIEERA